MPKNKNFGGAGFTPPTSEGGGNGIIPGRVKKVFLNVEDGGDIIPFSQEEGVVDASCGCHIY